MTRILVILMLICVASCVKPVVLDSGAKVFPGNDVSPEKAEAVALAYLAQAERYRGERVTIGKCIKEYRDLCYGIEAGGDPNEPFCGCDYAVSYSNDPYCTGSSRVVETCNQGACTYRFGERIEICA